MAHQTHAIPWETLSSHFKFVPTNQKYDGKTNLYPTFKPDQSGQLQHFARVVATRISEFSAQQRKQYPEILVRPTEDEIIISDSTARKIAPTVAKYKANNPGGFWDEDRNVDLTMEERKARYWIENMEEPSRSNTIVYTNDTMMECIALLKTLILYGDVEPLLRLATGSRIDLSPLWPVSFRPDTDEFGWKDLKTCVLMPYICFNLLYIRPELWDLKSRKGKLAEIKSKYRLEYKEEEYDYRNTSAYQKTLYMCTGPRWKGKDDVCTYPHRAFFGLEKHMVRNLEWSEKKKLGTGPPSVLLEPAYRGLYVPSAADVSTTLSLLKKILPTEIALQVLEYADYIPKRRMAVINDPLHPENIEELKKYLAYCWDVLVRIDMVVKEGGQWVDWEYEVMEVIDNLVGGLFPKMVKTVDDRVL